jgi:hypothetical protein
MKFSGKTGIALTVWVEPIATPGARKTEAAWHLFFPFFGKNLAATVLYDVPSGHLIGGRLRKIPEISISDGSIVELSHLSDSVACH